MTSIIHDFYTDVDYKLVVPSLNNDIDTVTYKKKGDKFVLSLKKSTETSWFDLKKKWAEILMQGLV